MLAGYMLDIQPEYGGILHRIAFFEFFLFDGIRVCFQMMEQNVETVQLFFHVGKDFHFAGQNDRAVFMGACAIYVSAVLEDCCADGWIGCEHVQFMALRRAMEKKCMVGFIVAVTQRNDVWLVIAAHGYGDKFALCDDILKLLLIRNLTVMPPHMVCCHDVSP